MLTFFDGFLLLGFSSSRSWVDGLFFIFGHLDSDREGLEAK